MKENLKTYEINDLLKKSHYLEVINSFAVQLLKCSSVDEIVWGVAKHAIAKLGFIDCVVYLFDDDNEYLIQRAAHGPKNPIDFDIDNPIKLKIGQGICGHVALTGKPELISDTSKDTRYKVDDASRLSELAVPILSEGSVIGVIDSEHPEKNFYTEEDLDLLTTIAAMASSKIIEAKIQEQLKNHQVELEKLVQERTVALNQTIDQLEQSNREKEWLLGEITDSINYAKTIQNAILPSDKKIKEKLPNSFVFYKPKDIVAGDFYWLEDSREEILLAVCDCTGHGVPGAIVSVICNNALNRAVRGFKLTDPGEILDKCRKIIIEEFEKGDEQIKDGMDIALCSINQKYLKYSGANNPLWLIRNNQLIEFEPCKQPIGYFEVPEKYRTVEIELQLGDTFYMFSDGFQDQFGGERGKKLKSKLFKSLLLSLQDKTMDEQFLLIEKFLELWKKDFDQVDDICIIGFRI